MEYRQLGRTDLKVSQICLGTMTWGEQNTMQDAHEQLDYATANGVNFIDTAEVYAVPVKAETYTLTEQYIGQWLKNRSDRDQLVIASKVAGPSRPEWIGHVRGGPKLNADHIERAVEASLKRLNTDYLDVYQVHWPSRNTNYFGQLGYPHGKDQNRESIEETLRAMDSLVKSGKVRHIGVSNETPWGLHQYLSLSEKHDLARIVTIQNPYNLLNRTFEVGLSEYSHREQVGLLAYSPLGFGTLSGKYLGGERPEGSRMALHEKYFPRYLSETAQTMTAKYAALAQEHDLTPAQMALAFVNSRPFVTANIIGATKLEQLKENIASAEVKLSDDVLKGINKLHNEQPNPCP